MAQPANRRTAKNAARVECARIAIATPLPLQAGNHRADSQGNQDSPSEGLPPDAAMHLRRPGPGQETRRKDHRHRYRTLGKHHHPPAFVHGPFQQ